MKNLKYIFFSFLLLGLWSCNEVEDVLEDNGVSTPEDLPALTAGSADFSNYVAIGNSLTIGVTDNGVFRATQINSYPNILAGQFASVGGGDFVQAMTADNFGGLSLGPDNGVPIAQGGARIFGPRLVFNGSGRGIRKRHWACNSWYQFVRQPNWSVQQLRGSWCKKFSFTR